MKTLPSQVVVALLAAGAALLAYDHLVVQPGRVIGVVDVGEIYRLKEAEFAGMVTAGTSDQDRERALALAQDFAQRLPVALSELPFECGCLVVMRSAIAGQTPHTIELTAYLQHKLQPK